MIEFQLTIYMCSQCTQVHNGAENCLRHEADVHGDFITTETVVSKVGMEKDTAAKGADSDCPRTEMESDTSEIDMFEHIGQGGAAAVEPIDETEITAKRKNDDQDEQIISVKRAKVGPIQTHEQAENRMSIEVLNHSTTQSDDVDPQRPFKCTVCFKRFKMFHSVNRHMKMHSDPQIKCELCAKAFYRNDVLAEHHLSVHKEYKCEKCDTVSRGRKEHLEHTKRCGM